MRERGKGVSSEPLQSLFSYAPVMGKWMVGAEKPTSPNCNCPLSWLQGGGHEGKWRVRGTDGDTYLCC